MAMTVPAGALGGIGNTPLVSLQRVVPAGSARVLVKLEWANPTGSMKDRMARAAIQAAAADGRLAPGDTVVEYTAGTTGISLAFVCAALGYRLHVAFSDAFSDEKRHTMQAFGATVTDVPSDGGRITEALIKAMIAKSQELAAQPGHWWCDQLNNHDAIDGYVPMGEEIWQQSGGTVDAFVHAVGTAHSIHGVRRALRGTGPDVAGHRRRARGVGGAVRRSDRLPSHRGHRHRVPAAALAAGAGGWHRAGQHRRRLGDDPTPGP